MGNSRQPYIVTPWCKWGLWRPRPHADPPHLLFLMSSHHHPPVDKERAARFGLPTADAKKEGEDGRFDDATWKAMSAEEKKAAIAARRNKKQKVEEHFCNLQAKILA